MNIRPAQENDISNIAALHTISWRTTYMDVLTPQYLTHDIEQDRLNTWSERIKNPPQNQIILVAETHNEFLGFGCLYLDKDPQWGALLDNLHVQPHHKGKGIGKVLMREIAHRCENNIGLYLWVLECNVAAQIFYQKLGAVHTQTDVWPAPDGSNATAFRYIWPKPISFGL
jgi:ribosomal protein S18 acetylase RimI-like enzyme